MSSSVKSTSAVSPNSHLTDEQLTHLDYQNSSRIKELQNHGERMKAERAQQQAESKAKSQVANEAIIRKPASKVEEATQLYNKNGAMNMKAYKPKPPAPEAIELKEDVFYKVVDRGNKMSEDSDGYYIEAYAPESEKNNVKVSVSEGKAVVSGSRKAQNDFENSEKKISTNNFQTFREEFAITKPIESKGMKRERKGDYIHVFIPKVKT